MDAPFKLKSVVKDQILPYNYSIKIRKEKNLSSMARWTTGEVNTLSRYDGGFDTRTGHHYVEMNLAAWIRVCETRCVGSTPISQPIKIIR